MNTLCRSIALGFCALAFLLPLRAQTGTASSDAVAQIRQRYAEAHEMMAYNNTSLETQNQLTVNGSFMCPGTGHRDEQIQYFFTTDFDEDSGNYASSPYFIMRSYNVAARRFYEEFLYNNQGDLIFSYFKGDDFEGGTAECRYYWNDGGELVHKQIQGQPEQDPVLTCRLSYDLLEAFHRLMNREF
ncbi:MAG: hypothetical protein IJT98_09160 [Prevotella sp.]|nr:hypothetical protein [Prevotella sp.]